MTAREVRALRRQLATTRRRELGLRNAGAGVEDLIVVVDRIEDLRRRLEVAEADR